MSTAASRLHDTPRSQPIESSPDGDQGVPEAKIESIGPENFMHHVFNHLKFAAVGLVVGVLASLALVNYGPDYVQASPLYTALAITLVFTLVGGMLAGFLALRPERYLDDLDARKHGSGDA